MLQVRPRHLLSLLYPCFLEDEEPSFTSLGLSLFLH